MMTMTIGDGDVGHQCADIIGQERTLCRLIYNDDADRS